MTAPPITHVFVLMLENRSFDSMLGFSGLTGTDPVTGGPTALNGLTGSESNAYGGTAYPVVQQGYQSMAIDPGHEFPDVVVQLCGGGQTYPPLGPYPAIDNSGFVNNYVTSASADEGGATSDLGAVMRGYTAEQLPVLTALAQNFAVCDNWYSSLPGPTWPNRFFAHGASSNGLDTSPTKEQMAGWQASGMAFVNGCTFSQLDGLGKYNGVTWRLFSDSAPGFTISTALAGVDVNVVSTVNEFCVRVQYPVYAWPYTFIEPNYGDVIDATYTGGNSQHPIDMVWPGEALIKQVYEAIRSSPYWENSLLIVTYDEHGGFYDHVSPPAAVAPGDTQPLTGLNTYGFMFNQYGVRVSAVVVSPFVPGATIDHRLYDHSSIPALLGQLYGFGPLTARDAQANNPMALLSLQVPRPDTPPTLPPANPFTQPTAPAAAVAPKATDPIPASQRGFVALAMKTDIQMNPAAEAAIRARVASLRTVGEARAYLAEVKDKYLEARAVGAARAQSRLQTKRDAAEAFKARAVKAERQPVP